MALPKHLCHHLACVLSWWRLKASPHPLQFYLPPPTPYTVGRRVRWQVLFIKHRYEHCNPDFSSGSWGQYPGSGLVYRSVTNVVIHTHLNALCFSVTDLWPFQMCSGSHALWALLVLLPSWYYSNCNNCSNNDSMDNEKDGGDDRYILLIINQHGYLTQIFTQMFTPWHNLHRKCCLLLLFQISIYMLPS